LRLLAPLFGSDTTPAPARTLRLLARRADLRDDDLAPALAAVVEQVRDRLAFLEAEVADRSARFSRRSPRPRNGAVLALVPFPEAAAQPERVQVRIGPAEAGAERNAVILSSWCLG
jgi:hypothetical protein